MRVVWKSADGNVADELKEYSRFDQIRRFGFNSVYFLFRKSLFFFVKYCICHDRPGVV